MSHLSLPTLSAKPDRIVTHTLRVACSCRVSHTQRVNLHIGCRNLQNFRSGAIIDDQTCNLKSGKSVGFWGRQPRATMGHDGPQPNAAGFHPTPPVFKSYRRVGFHFGCVPFSSSLWRERRSVSRVNLLCVFTKSIIRQLAGGPEPRTTQQGVFVVFEKKMNFKLVTEERIGLKNY